MTAALLDKVVLSTPTRFSKSERDVLEDIGYPLLHVSGFEEDGEWYVLDSRSPNDDFCRQCGFVTDQIEFLEHAQCPNSECPKPEFWNV